MKKNLFLIAAAAMVMMTGCSKDNNTMTVDGTPVSQAIVAKFNKQYPNATNVKWNARGGYTIATFDLAATKAASDAANTNTAWYDDAANCRMEELNINPTELPQPIQDAWAALQTGKYAGCHIDDIDRISRDGFASVYVLEVEDGKSIDVDLYFSEDGILLRELPDGAEDDDDDKYDTLISDVDMEKFNKFLTERYTKFDLIEADIEDDGTFEIEILVTKDGKRIEIDVIFDKDGKFLYEEAEVEFEKVDKLIQDFIKANYANAEIEEVEIRTYADNSVKFVFEYETEVDGEEVELQVVLQIVDGKVEVVK